MLPNLQKFSDKTFERLDPDDRQEFFDHNRYSSLFTIRVILILSLFLNPLWLVFDYYLIPDVLSETLVMRLVTTSIVAALLGLTFLKSSYRYVSWIGGFLVIYITAFIFVVVDKLMLYLDPSDLIFDLNSCVLFAFILLLFFPSFLSAFLTALLAIVASNITLAYVSDNFNPLMINMPIFTMAVLVLGIHVGIINTKIKAFKFQKATEKMAVTDELTGLYNRRYFVSQEEEVERSLRYKRPLSLIMMDIDNFKKVNDEHGHLAGDLVLKEISKLCANQIRKPDLLARIGQDNSEEDDDSQTSSEDPILGRIGGEEYAVLLPETGTKGAETVAERMRKTVAKTPIKLSGGVEIKVTMSFGISSLRHDQSKETLETILLRADKALYEAKRQGKNRVVTFSG